MRTLFSTTDRRLLDCAGWIVTSSIITRSIFTRLIAAPLIVVLGFGSYWVATKAVAETIAPPPIIDQLLPYHPQLKKREIESLELIVIHCTESPDLTAARTAGEEIRYDSGTGNSGHYYIDRDGTIYRYVADDRVAHHVIGFNETSIGIELVNTGRAPNWFHSEHQQVSEAYPEAQIQALLALLRHLESRYPHLRHIAGHHHLDLSLIETTDQPGVKIRRKVDPGPLFPWDRIMEVTRLQRISREPQSGS